MWITTRDEHAAGLGLGVLTGTQDQVFARALQLDESRIDSYGAEPARELPHPDRGTGPDQGTGPVPAAGTPQARQERADQEHYGSAGELVVRSLVWRSPRSGALLSRGRALTQQQAIHAILTHSRNEIIQSQTTTTRITYRTPAIHSISGSVCVYEGTAPGSTASIPAQNPAPRGQSRTDGPAAVSGRVSVRRLAEALGVDTGVAGDILTELQNRRRDLGRPDRPELMIVHDEPPQCS
jgi:hypothetical protein